MSLRQKEGKWECSLRSLQEQGWESMVTWLTASATQLDVEGIETGRNSPEADKHLIALDNEWSETPRASNSQIMCFRAVVVFLRPLHINHVLRLLQCPTMTLGLCHIPEIFDRFTRPHHLGICSAVVFNYPANAY